MPEGTAYHPAGGDQTMKSDNGGDCYCPFYWIVLGLVLPGLVDMLLGPLHTQAKSRDHKIVGVQEKVFKSRPKIPPKLCRCRH